MHRFSRLLALILTVCVASPAWAATLTTTQVTTAGQSILTGALTAVSASGDKCPNDGDTFAVVLNSSGANAYTITTDVQNTSYGNTVTDASTTVAVSAHVVFGPFPTAAFSDSGGYVNFTYTGSAPATDLKIKCFRIAD